MALTVVGTDDQISAAWTAACSALHTQLERSGLHWSDAQERCAGSAGAAYWTFVRCAAGLSPDAGRRTMLWVAADAPLSAVGVVS
jgi:hypothetical protein